MFFISRRALKTPLSYIPEIILPETCYKDFFRDLGEGSDSFQWLLQHQDACLLNIWVETASSNFKEYL